MNHCLDSVNLIVVVLDMQSYAIHNDLTHQYVQSYTNRKENYIHDFESVAEITTHESTVVELQ